MEIISIRNNILIKHNGRYRTLKVGDLVQLNTGVSANKWAPVYENGHIFKIIDFDHFCCDLIDNDGNKISCIYSHFGLYDLKEERKNKLKRLKND